MVRLAATIGKGWTSAGIGPKSPPPANGIRLTQVELDRAATKDSLENAPQILPEIIHGEFIRNLKQAS
jgi:hypothetical protein